MKPFLLLFGLLAVCEVRGSDVDSLRGMYHVYEPPEIVDTPAPRGYKAVYISHYGRHGSRYHLSSSIVTRGLDSLKAASERGTLTPLGEEVLVRLEDIDSLSKGRWAALAPRGVLEQEGIGMRMLSRFPGVFRGRIEAFSSLRPRCISSMNAMTDAIGKARPSLKITKRADSETASLLKNDSFRTSSSAWYDSRIDSATMASRDWSKVISRLYTDCSCEKMEQMRLVRWIWHAWAEAPCLGVGDFDILNWLTFDELSDMSAWFDMNLPLKCLRTDVFQESRVETQRGLLRDIVSKADSALRDGKTSATLRYGHDANLVPLMGLMNAEGFDRVFVLQDRPERKWNSSRMIPMGSNVQLVFYKRGKKDPILVKVLYNEKETLISGVEAVSGPYYDWNVLKRFWGCASSEHEVAIVPNGEMYSTGRIQHAVDSVSALGSGRVTLRGGTFLSASIELKSGVDLHIEEGAVLLASPRLEDYQDRAETRHFDTAALPRGRNVAFIWADEANDISISGKGVIDGNGTFHVREKPASAANGWPFERISPAEQSLPRMVFFAGCRNVSVSEVSMVNQPAGWGYWIHDCDRVRFRDCTILNDVRYPNNDGIHVNCSRDIFISGCHIESGDDSIVIRANSRSLRENKVCERVVVTDCTLRSWSSAVRIGWVGDGMMRDCSLTRLRIVDSSNGIGCYLPKFQYVEASNDYGRESTAVENFWFDDVSMDEVYGNPIYFVVPAEDPKVDVSAFRDVRFRRTRCRSLSLPYISRRADVDVSGILFLNCSFMLCAPADFPGDCRKHGYVLRKM